MPTDKERLDWLDKLECGFDHEAYGDYRYYSGEHYRKMGLSVRDIIDRAMSPPPKGSSEKP